MTDILRSPKAWGPVFVVGVLLAFLYFLVNFSAAKSPPEASLRNRTR